MAFSSDDIKQITNRGLSPETVYNQLNHFKTGFAPIKLVSAATPGFGIRQIEEDEAIAYIQKYEQEIHHHKVTKFVPASGAATRMFKDILAYRNKLDKDQDIPFTAPVSLFFDNLSKFAFYPELKRRIPLHHENFTPKERKNILDVLLTDAGMNYANLPKGLLSFHYTPHGEVRTPVEEHLVEGARYCIGADRCVHIHFTVSPHHEEHFRAHLKLIQPIYEKLYHVCYEISFSHQKPKTDTLAVTLDNEPLRDQDNRLLFRPGGHGALIHNLNELNSEIVFIKNIDNVTPDHLKQITVHHKKVLGGILLEIQQKAHHFLNLLTNDKNIKDNTIKEIIEFVNSTIGKASSPLKMPEEKDALHQYLFKLLNRPIRVCGMVKNSGEKGGGPFWCKNSEDVVNLQIVEGPQMDMNNPEQKAIVDNATHFNPVDLVCCLRDYKGDAFDLTQYIDQETGFISTKSNNGRDLKALELPGLWNGAMAHWISVFVEVPAITFTPVKTVNDLIRKEHIL